MEVGLIILEKQELSLESLYHLLMFYTILTKNKSSFEIGTGARTSCGFGISFKRPHCSVFG